MFLGPVFSLEMVTSARRTRYFWIRTLYAVCLLVAMTFSWLTFSPFAEATNRATANFAANFFIVFSYLQMSTILLLTPGMVAGTMAQENERRTIEYLLTSQLGNAEIVLSKLGSRLLQVAMQVLVGLPILAIVTMLGGIEFATLAIVFMLSLVVLLAIAALSIAISVGCRRAKDALMRSYVLVLAFLFVPSIFAGVMRLLSKGASTWYTDIAEFLATLNPFIMLSVPFLPIQIRGADPMSILGIRMACYGGFALVCAVLAASSVRRVFLRHAQGTTNKTKVRRPKWLLPDIDRWPMIWKEMVAEQGISQWGIAARIGLWLLIIATIAPFGVVFGGILLFASNFDSPMRDEPYVACLVGVGTCWECFVLLLLAGRAACSITSEKERDCWTSLISTDLTPSEILAGKLVSNLYACRWLLALPLLFWSLEVVLRPDFLLVIPVLIMVRLLLAVVVTMAGLWCSLYCANSLRAMGLALPSIGFIGAGYLACCGLGTIIAIMILTGGRGGDGAAIVWLILAPCMPYLLFAPETGWMALRFQHSGPSEPYVVFLAAWIIGVVGYAAAGVMLWNICRDQFDRLAGRTSISQPRVGAIEREGGISGGNAIT